MSRSPAHPPTPFHCGPADPRAWAETLLGRPLPSILFADGEGSVIDLAITSGRGLVLYAQPGILVPPHDNLDSARQDALQHDSYIALHHSFARVIPDGAIVGIAAYPDRDQFDSSREWIRQSPLSPGAIAHHLLGDPHLRLADSLQLPTQQIEEHRYYQRTTIVATNGRIAKVFHPATAGRDAQQALAWLQLH